MKTIDNVSAGNYWLTKSMEFNKISNAGTLWYLKKWITYYYYIFMRENIFESDYTLISNVFTEFIESLPTPLKTKAENYFFEKDIRSSNFVSFQEFIKETPVFNSADEKILFLMKAKKFYFIYIMNIGGQSNYKELTLSCIQNGYGLMKTLNHVKEKMLSDGQTIEKYKQEIEGDFHAAIRNERQIFFYYGFFHGKEESSLNGYYTLTPIGKSILRSNFHEIIVVWEHQKLKMTSQSPVSDIQNLNSSYDASKFSINYHPYYSLLKSIDKLGSIEFNDYRYLISRTKTTFPIDNAIELLKSDRLLALTEFKRKAESFNRPSDTRNEDFQKELKKYMLGIFEHDTYKQDLETNPYSSLAMSRNYKISVNKPEKFKFTIDLFEKITNYLDLKFIDQYIDFEKELKTKYESSINDQSFKLSKNTKYNWSKYIINFDTAVFYSVIYWGCCCSLNKFSGNISKSDFNTLFDNYKNLMKLSGSSKKDFVEYLEKIQSAYLKGDLNQAFIEEKEYEIERTDPRKVFIEVKIDNLKMISSSQTVEFINGNLIKRKRNHTLIQYMKSYYYTQFINDNNLINCECCTNETFETINDTPYIEFHHLIPFSTDNGPDHYLNLFGLCPSCHRKVHFSKNDLRNDIYQNISKNNLMGIKIKDRIQSLYLEGLLEPIHLDFLLKENIITEEEFESFMSKPANAA